MLAQQAGRLDSLVVCGVTDMRLSVCTSQNSICTINNSFITTLVFSFRSTKPPCRSQNCKSRVQCRRESRSAGELCVIKGPRPGAGRPRAKSASGGEPCIAVSKRVVPDRLSLMVGCVRLAYFGANLGGRFVGARVRFGGGGTGRHSPSDCQ